ncbi:Protein DYAD [Glycine max]|nr:Protein DYAD [Glycine max]
MREGKIIIKKHNVIWSGRHGFCLRFSVRFISFGRTVLSATVSLSLSRFNFRLCTDWYASISDFTSFFLFSSVPQFASHLRFLGFSFWFFLNWGFGFPVALISSHWTRIEHVLPIFFVDYGDFAFSDLLLMPLCFGEINRLISVRDLYCRFNSAAGMDQWDAHHRLMFIGRHEEDGTADTSKGEESNDEEKISKTEPVFVPETKKRKRLSLSQLKEVKEESHGKQSSSKSKRKKHDSRDRWSAERYQLAEQNMWEVLKAEGATFENPITRPALRLAARKHIGDTGLLDHLLKHIDGKVAPGGTERFRRWFNTNGIMEYWLESADLDKVRQEAGVQDPYWIPPSTYREAGAPSQNIDSSGELKQLKIELMQMKKY